ncbi:MAG: hypothetical protein IPN29_15515 [Saprospiraceae bacterium]|nr:hypothetical protein [Saprospiraceae bacterium]
MMFVSSFTFCQSIDIGFAIGSSTYQGDISPLGWRISYQGSKPARGLLLGYNFTESFVLKLGYYKTRLEAYDADAIDDWRPTRNLSFRTDISEFALHAEWQVMDHWQFFRNFSLKPVFHLGVGIFKFNPQTKYKGQWYNLQPLSTEGQGLPGSPDNPYKLTQWVIPFGFGLRYHITDRFSIELSTNPRKTFTDYLDDVSGNYYNLDLLKKYKGPLAAKLAFRGDENSPTATRPVEGQGRGNAVESDWYLIHTLTFTYRLQKGWPFRKNRQIRCPY